MSKLIGWIKRVLAAMRPDPCASIASTMRMEGYTDFEINEAVRQIKESNDE